MLIIRSEAGERGHGDATREVKVAELERLEKT
jgi:hypothetical protein